MKFYAYLILAVIASSILLQPLGEIGIYCRDSIALSCAVNNAFRVAERESFVYTDLRDLDAEVNEEKFSDVFAETFAAALDMSYVGTKGGSMHFVPKYGNEVYHDFFVDVSFSNSSKNGHKAKIVNVSAESDYRFKMQLMRQAEAVIARNGDSCKLRKDRRMTVYVKY